MHAVETMGYVGMRPWHELGTNITDPAIATDPTRFQIECGLDWQVEKVPVICEDTHQATTHFATRRQTDGRVLGVVGPRYEVFQNERMFEWFAPFLESGEALFETGGSLKDGTIVWALAKVCDLEELVKPGDRVASYVLLSHAHDGTQSIRAGFTTTRVVCFNTLSAAHSSSESKLLRVPHTRSHEKALELIRETMELQTQEFKADADLYRKLAQTRVNEKDLKRYIQAALTDTITEEEFEDLSPQLQNQVDRAFELAISGMGNSGETLWDGYNGITQYLTWEKGRSEDSRLRSLWFGSARDLNAHALDVARQLVAA